MATENSQRSEILEFAMDAGDFFNSIGPMTAQLSFLFPVIIRVLVATRKAIIRDDKDLGAAEREAKLDFWLSTEIMLISSWALTHSESMIAEGACIAGIGLSPWAGDLLDATTTGVSNLRAWNADTKEHLRQGEDAWLKILGSK